MNHKDIIDKWPRQAKLANDLQVSLNTVKSFKHRNRIPAKYWEALIAAARRRKITGVTVNALMDGLKSARR